MMNMLERLACWFLRRRGRVVLPHPFFGMAIGGGAMAVRQEDGRFLVHVPRTSQLIVLNHSMLDNRSKSLGDSEGGAVVGFT